MRSVSVLLAPLVAVLALFASNAHADAAPPARAGVGEAALADGQVLEVDRQARTVLIKHGPIASLGMDAMTMEFAVRDAALLASLRPGDSLRFAAVYRDGDYVLTQVRRVKRGGAAPAK